MALLLPKIDNQSGSLDRFVISVPKPCRPMPSAQMEASAHLREQGGIDFKDIYNRIQSNTNTTFTSVKEH